LANWAVAGIHNSLFAAVVRNFKAPLVNGCPFKYRKGSLFALSLIIKILSSALSVLLLLSSLHSWWTEDLYIWW